MDRVLLILQIILAIICIFLIIIQAKGTGLGRAFGSGGIVSFKRRGLEKLIFKLTFITTFFFIFISILQLFI